MKISDAHHDQEPKPTEDHESSQKWLSADRLPKLVEGDRVWRHELKGENHRIRFCASEDISLVGIGLRVKAPIQRLQLYISHVSRNPNEEHSGPIFHFMENFENLPANSSDGSVVVKLRHGVKLSCERIYLLVLTLHGGASLVGTGGQEFVSVRRSGGGAGGSLQV